MATTNGRAALRIPAGYLEDVRTALVAELRSDTAALADNQTAVLSAENEQWRETCTEDRAVSRRSLRQDLDVLDQLLAATGDAEVLATSETLTVALQEMVRILLGRLAEQADYGPIPLGAVLELVGRLRWAAEEAIRIEPSLNR